MAVALILTTKGIEDLCSDEIKRYTGMNAVLGNGFVLVENVSLHDLVLLSYALQSASRVIMLIGSTNAGSMEIALAKLVENTESSWLIPKRRVSVRCEKVVETEWKSPDGEHEGSRLLAKKFPELTLEYKNPEMQLTLVIAEKEWFLGIDVAGMDLGKREYKI